MSSGAVNALVAWAASQGAGFEAVEVRTAANGNRGVVARRDIAAGEQVMLVPRELVITDLDVAATPLGADLRALAPRIRSPHSALAAWLALERRAPGTRWRPYLEALPTASWMPSLRSDAELASLAGTRAFDLIAEARLSVALDHEVLADALVELTDVSLAEFGWARDRQQPRHPRRRDREPGAGPDRRHDRSWRR